MLFDTATDLPDQAFNPPFALTMTNDALRLYKATRHYQPTSINALPDGAIIFEWIRSNSQRFLVAVPGDGRLSYAGFFEGAAEPQTIPFGSELPAVVSVQLALLYKL